MYRAACASVGYVGRSDKKDSCGVVYFEKKRRSVILLHRKHSASVCIRLLILPIFPRQAATPSFTNSCAFLREKMHSRGYLGLTIRSNMRTDCFVDIARSVSMQCIR